MNQPFQDLAICSRVLALIPTTGVLTDAQRRDFERCVHGLGMHAFCGPSFAIAADVARCAGDGGMPGGLLNIDPGKINGPRLKGLSARDRDTTATLGRWFEFYNLLTLSGTELLVQSDPLGLKPLYIATTSDALLLANRVLDLLALRPDLEQPIDLTALRELIALGYPLQCRTLHARIKRTPPAATLKIIAGRMQVIETDLMSETEVPETELSAAVTRIGDTLESVLRSRIGSATAWLGLTGGFDSRLLLGAALAARVDLEAITYGADDHAEVAVARAVARLAQVKHRVVPISPSNVRDMLPLNLAAIEATARPIVSIANLLSAAPTAPVTLIHGFLGDALGGSNLTKWVGGVTHLAADEAATLILRANWNWQSQYPAIYGLSEEDDAVLADIHAGLDHTRGNHQSVILWDLRQRQRRLISGHFRLLGERYDLSVPYYAPELLAAYLALPRQFLDGRKLTRALLSQRYPHLARVRHDEEIWPLRPSLCGWFDGTRLTLAQRWHRWQRFAPPRADIWAAAGSEVKRSREEFLDAIEQHHPHLQRLLPGVPNYARDVLLRTNAKAVLQLRNLCDYAAALAQRPGAEQSK